MATPLPGMVLLSPDEVRPSPNNPRKTMDGIEDLAASIEQVGLLQPITVQRVTDASGRPVFEVVYGHRRLAAMRLLRKREIPAIVRRPMPQADALAARIVENDQRASLDPIEEALALRELQRETTPERTLAQVGARIGRSVNYVGRRLMLLDLPLEEQEKVRAGHYSVNYAEGLIRDERAKARNRRAPGERGAIGRPRGAKTKPYFGDSHPLAEAVRTRCTGLRHHGMPKVSGVGCGPCWEYVLRADERENPTDVNDLDLQEGQSA